MDDMNAGVHVRTSAYDHVIEVRIGKRQSDRRGSCRKETRHSAAAAPPSSTLAALREAELGLVTFTLLLDNRRNPNTHPKRPPPSCACARTEIGQSSPFECGEARAG
jgi:hypothetical protein